MSGQRQSELIIETPEGVAFSYQLATPVSRALAWAVDAAVLGVVASIIGTVVASFKVISEDLAAGLTVLLYFATSVGYAIVLEWRCRGQTIGKRLFGLRVIDAHGLRLQFSQVVVRNLMRVFDTLPMFYLVGGIAAFHTRYAQRLGDLAAATVVARDRGLTEPDVDAVAPAKYNSLAAYPHLAARLRSVAPPEAVGIALRAVTQRARYSSGARIELFQELASYFRSLVKFPEEALIGISDEEYVRSALRVILAAPVRR
jgi:uncharacterized RDD family membrane protein YckC